MLQFFCLFLLSSMLALNVNASSDIVLTPNTTASRDLGLIFIQGASVTPDKYLPLIATITSQLADDFNLYIGIPAYLLDTPEPLVLAGGISRIVQSMQKAGFKTGNNIIFVGHSIGGVMIQTYTIDKVVSGYPTVGQILLGSYLTRSSRTHQPTFPVPTLSLGGELDGLTRITRMTEAFWYDHVYPSTDINNDFHTNNAGNHSTVIINGMNHMGCCTGAPPAFVKSRDLVSELSEDAAHTALANVMTAFILERLTGDDTSRQQLNKYIEQTRELVAPVYAAFMQEGYHNYLPPCTTLDASDTELPTCFTGSPFSATAQSNLLLPLSLSLALNFSVSAVDTFHAASQSLLPVINNRCSPSGACTLNVQTYTEATYESLDSIDGAFTFVSATELRVKMVSAQALLSAGDYASPSFNLSDTSSSCRLLNTLTYQQALDNSAAVSKSRFTSYGIPYTFADDVGPLSDSDWVSAAIQFNNIKNSAGKISSVQIVSPSTRTALDAKTEPGLHFCKLLSPARATEWIYVDSLRPQ